jgi:hypothetical protein
VGVAAVAARVAGAGGLAFSRTSYLCKPSQYCNEGTPRYVQAAQATGGEGADEGDAKHEGRRCEGWAGNLINPWQRGNICDDN